MFEPNFDGNVTTPARFLAGTAGAGIKYTGRPDIALILSHSDCTAAAVFTQNRVVAAPVVVDRETLAADNAHIRAVVANAGNANACTGEPGLANARTMQQITAASVGCHPGQVLVGRALTALYMPRRPDMRKLME